MKKWFIVGAVTFVVSMLAAGTGLAHHAFAAEYDKDKPVTVKGTIVKMQWINPHSWLHIDVKEPDGTVNTWALEFGSPNSLLRKGWRAADLPVGEEVTAVGYLAKNGSRTIHADTVTLPNGRTLFPGAPGTDAPSTGGAPPENR